MVNFSNALYEGANGLAGGAIACGVVFGLAKTLVAAKVTAASAFFAPALFLTVPFFGAVLFVSFAIPFLMGLFSSSGSSQRRPSRQAAEPEMA